MKYLRAMLGYRYNVYLKTRITHEDGGKHVVTNEGDCIYIYIYMYVYIIFQVLQRARKGLGYNLYGIS